MRRTHTRRSSRRQRARRTKAMQNSKVLIFRVVCLRILFHVEFQSSSVAILLTTIALTFYYQVNASIHRAKRAVMDLNTHDPPSTRFNCIGPIVPQGFGQVRDLLCPVATPYDPIPDHAYSNTTDVVAGNPGDQSATMSPEKKEVHSFSSPTYTRSEVTL